MVEVRISKVRVLILALILAVVLPAFTWWMLDGVRTPEAFQALQIANDGDRRCLLCGMSYGPYLSLTFVIVGAVDILFGAAAVVGLLRAFGPPTLLITAEGTGRYVLPWRTRTFRIAPGATIKVGALGTRFDPPLETPDGPLANVNLRLRWSDHSPGRLATRLAELNSGWNVSVR
jgi:hypothetical protein